VDHGRDPLGQHRHLAVPDGPAVVDLDQALNDVDGALRVVARGLEPGAGLKLQVHVVQRREGADAGLHAHRFAGDQAALHARLNPGRQIA